MNRTYELMFIVRPDMVEEEQDKLISTLETAVTSSGGNVKSVEKMGKRVRVPGAHVEIARIRRDREGFLVEAEKLGVHVALLGAATRSTAYARRRSPAIEPRS